MPRAYPNRTGNSRRLVRIRTFNKRDVRPAVNTTVGTSNPRRPRELIACPPQIQFEPTNAGGVRVESLRSAVNPAERALSVESATPTPRYSLAARGLWAISGLVMGPAGSTSQSKATQRCGSSTRARHQTAADERSRLRPIHCRLLGLVQTGFL